jgi:hypothetical protein
MSTEMKKFGSIESLRNVVANVRRWTDFHKTAAPTITFKGTVKLHGSNGGVTVTPDGLIAQSRNNILDLNNDNAGFAQFVARDISTHAFALLAHYLHYQDKPGVHVEEGAENHYIFYGEWCGGSIQKGVALNELPKHFVIFAVRDTDTDEMVTIDWQSLLIESDVVSKGFQKAHPTFSEQTILDRLHAAGVYLIDEARPQFITIDFANPEKVTQDLEERTLAYEEECPWAALFGVKGIGEGIVWMPTGEFADKREWAFKVKGLLHQKSNKTKPTNLVHVDPVKVEKVAELIAEILPEWRLEQGISEVKQANGGVISTKNMGEFLQWISRDILKEHSDTIANNEFDWKKDISPKVIQTARDYFLRSPL